MEPTPQAPSHGTLTPHPPLRRRAETLGHELADALSALVAGLPGSPSGPSAVGNATGQTTVTASRFLKAISLPDPVAVLRTLPGPVPLRRLVEGARGTGAAEAVCERCLVAISALDQLIREVAGDRSSFHALLSAWLPDERAEFEAQRRQTLHKAYAELEGVSCDLDLSAILVHPSETEGMIDLVNAQALLGVDRMRPDATVKLGTRRLGKKDGSDGPRVPLTLDGDAAVDGLHSARLDEFCAAPPAPFVGREWDEFVEYSLGPTGIGKAAKVDLVIAEVNRAEMEAEPETPGAKRFFYTIPEIAARRLVFDVGLHADVLPGRAPRLLSYVTGSFGAARVDDPARELDKRDVPEPLQTFADDWRGARISEFPRYGELLQHITSRLDWDLDRFRFYRVALSYPVVRQQLTIAFDPS